MVHEGGNEHQVAASALRASPGLKALSLSSNKLTDHEGAQILRALRVNAALTHLNLKDNQLDEMRNMMYMEDGRKTLSDANAARSAAAPARLEL